MERSDQINQAEQVVNLLRRFEHAVEVLREAQNAEATKGDRSRALDALAQEIARAEVALDQTRKESDAADRAVKARQRDLDAIQKSYVEAQKALDKVREQVDAEIAGRAQAVEKGAREAQEKVAQATAAYVAECDRQCAEAQAKLDAVNAKLESVRERLA